MSDSRKYRKKKWNFAGFSQLLIFAQRFQEPSRFHTLREKVKNRGSQSFSNFSIKDASSLRQIFGQPVNYDAWQPDFDFLKDFLWKKMSEGQNRKLSYFSNKSKNSMNDVDPQDLTAPIELSKGWFEFIKICKKNSKKSNQKRCKCTDNTAHWWINAWPWLIINF